MDRLRSMRYRLWLLAAAIAIAPVAGCRSPAVRPAAQTAKGSEQVESPVEKETPARQKNPARLGFTIQAGAFSQVENAAKLTSQLQEKGLAATYFTARRGLYKVRFGNFLTRELAQKRAEELRKSGVIDDFYIVRPEEYTIAKLDKRGESFLREELVRTARSFLGVPYLWGGNSADTGFDCSGLTMTVYQINGLDLPRSSGEQFAMGAAVNRSSLAKGDLVFFSSGGKKASHVGVYAGADLFIHAPEKGKHIRTDSLATEYYGRHFLGARTYLRN
jgi:cell wall-associated NlpC family hydrolase